MTDPAAPTESDAETSLEARIEAILRGHATRAEDHLRELESDMTGLLGDSGTIQEDRDGTRRLIESVRADLGRTQRALDRIAAGTFGRCISCGNTIAPARLEAIPESDHCTNCA